MIDIGVVEEAYDQQEFSQVGHVFSDQNPANGLTGVRKYQAVTETLDTEKLELDVNQWALRQKKDSITRAGKVRRSIS